jgi:hypothetical protein
MMQAMLGFTSETKWLRHAGAQREELWKALDFLREGDTLVVPSLDRLGRSIQDLIAIVSGLRKRGIGFASLHEALNTTTPGGRLVFHVFAALAEFIRELVAQRAIWDMLMPAQQYLLETLGIDPAAEVETVVPVRRSQDERWAVNLAAARQFHDREGHLRPSRGHLEDVDGVQVRLRAFVDNSRRRRAAKLSPQRLAALDELGMRW